MPPSGVHPPASAALPRPPEELELLLGHPFADRSLLLRALTHKSLIAELDQSANDPPPATFRDNEQLEFLGDAILGFLASDQLIRLRPNYPEGKLSRLKSHLVSSVNLHQIALQLRLGDFLILGRGEVLSGGRQKRALLANAVEALIAALYLDAGLSACRGFLDRYVWDSLPLDSPEGDSIPVDPKSALQEFAQSRRLPVPRYISVRESGPEHNKLFTVEARVGKEFAAQAEGSSKKIASRQAAALLLQRLTAQAD
ncbi:MAG: ribonuclease III [Candidatus Solibacter usitatus]|nr:ribonuclease III [Candidatus Solibacter usitatus]